MKLVEAVIQKLFNSMVFFYFLMKTEHLAKNTVKINVESIFWIRVVNQKNLSSLDNNSSKFDFFYLSKNPLH